MDGASGKTRRATKSDLKGATGATGAQGDKGATGAQGTQGSQGSASTVPGPTGPTGAQGDRGSQGSQGSASTVQGPTGPTGATGDRGSQGSQGSAGTDGARGSQGSAGATGPAGGSMNWLGAWALSQSYAVNDAVSHGGSSYICIQANTSDASTEPGVGASWTSYWNLTAQRGGTGPTGADGGRGSQGSQGSAGADSTVPGPTGATGPTGPQGTQGSAGNDGARGSQGSQGSAGSNGGTGFVSPRVTSQATASAPAPDADTTDIYALTAQDQTGAFVSPSGTPVNGQKLEVRIKSDGTAHALSFSTGYTAGGVALPTTAPTGRIGRYGFEYNTDNSVNRWELIAKAEQ